MKKKVLIVGFSLLLSSGFAVAGTDGDTVLICSVANPGVLAGLPHPPVLVNPVPVQQPWVVQLTAGRDALRLERLRAQVQGSVVMTTRNGEFQALRLRGFNSREAAQDALTRLRGQFPGAFITPE